MALLPTEVEITGAGVANAQQKTNFANIRNFIAELFGTDSANKAAAREGLGVAPRAVSVAIASVAGAVDLTIGAPDSDDITITGTLAITSFVGVAGRVMRVRAAGIFTLVDGAPIVTHTGANIVAGNGDSFVLRFTANNVCEVLSYVRALPLVPINVASAATVNLTTGAPSRDDIVITGAVAITGFVGKAGRVFRVRAGGAFTLTNNAAIVTQTGANRVCAAGDTFMLRFTADNVCELLCYVAAVIPQAGWQYSAEVATTSGTAIDLTGIPAWITEMQLLFDLVSGSSTAVMLLQLGTSSGGVKNSDYNAASGRISSGAVSVTNATGIPIVSSSASDSLSGILSISKAAGNKWVVSGNVTGSNVIYSAGGVTLPDVLDRVRLTSVGGTQTFDAGSLILKWRA